MYPQRLGVLTERGLTMTLKRTTSPTKKLAQLKEKMSTLRQEEEKIRQSLSQELSQCLINAQALEIDFDTLIGGILEVVTQANSNKPSPEQSRKTEAWQKSGQKFRQYQSRLNRSKEAQKGEQQAPHPKKRNPHSASSQTFPQPEEAA